MENIYLDYNSHTPCDIKVVEAMATLWQQPGNPHSGGHSFGWSKQYLIDESLKTLADLYGCFEEDFLFTSGATEANNMAIFSGIALAKENNPEANTILTSYLEHKSVLKPLEVAAKQHDLNLIYVNITTDGFIDLEDLEDKANTYQVVWLSCCVTNGIIGTNQPIQQVSELCQKYDIALHVDASQAGYLQIDCQDLDIDYLALSAHKIYGPSGIGLLYSKHLNHPNFKPLIYGGGQQSGLRAGTLPVPLIVGFTEAAKQLDYRRESESVYLAQLRQHLLTELGSELNIQVQGSLENRHPGNIHISIDGVDSMQLLNNIQPHIAFSLGSACDGLDREYSPLMKAMGVSRAQAEQALRLCVGRMTTLEEINRAADKIKQTALAIIHACG